MTCERCNQSWPRRRYRCIICRRLVCGYCAERIDEPDHRQPPAQHQRVVTDYFFHERRLLDTATALGIGDSRASQIKKEALGKLKEGLERRGVRMPEPVNEEA
mgnify:CR=1 FL=1